MLRLVQSLVGLAILANFWIWRGTLLAIYTQLKGPNQDCSFFEVARAQLNLNKLSSLFEKSEASRKLLERDSIGFELWETSLGRFWVPRGSEGALDVNVAEQQMNLYGDGGLGARPGDIVLDCGANIGLYTKRALLAGADLVVAIEPAPENLVCLSRNLKGEIARGKVIIYPKGVWDKDDVLKLNMPKDNSAGDSVVRKHAETDRSVEVELTTIDKLVDELLLRRVDFIKMDIEGAERNAIAGAAATIKKHHPRLAICVYHLEDDRNAVPRVVHTAWSGYKSSCGICFMRERADPDVMFYYP